MIRDHPVLGVGLDNFLYQYRTRYVLPHAWREPNLSHPHNVVLDLWTRVGILGLLVFVWLQWSFFNLGLATYRRLRGAPDGALVLALLALMVYSLSHGLIDNSFFLVDLAFVLALTVALMVRISQMDSPIQDVDITER
jgi:O-antigen ligase